MPDCNSSYPQESVLPYKGNESKALQVEKMFDHIAPGYDTLNHTMSWGIDRHWRKKAIRRLAPYNPQLIMDVATGTGDFAIKICQKLKPKALTGIDISEGMLNIGREKARRAGLERHIRFIKEDCAALSFPDGSFDAVTVAFGVRNFEHLDLCLKEIHRVLVSGGHLVILELSKPKSPVVKILYNMYTKIVPPVMGMLMVHDRQAYTYLPRSIKAFPQGEVMQDIIAKAGFREVSFKRLTLGACTLYFATK